MIVYFEKTNNRYEIENVNDFILFKTILEDNPELKEIKLEECENTLKLIYKSYLDSQEHYSLNINNLEKNEIEKLHNELLYFGNEKIIKEFYKNIKNREIKKYKKRIEDFFEKHILKVEWHALSKNTNLSEEFFEKYILDDELRFESGLSRRINWTYLSSNSNISEAFFKKYIDKIEWSY